MKTALITGITGQDGSYLAELLLNNGYMVYGVSRSLAAASDAGQAKQAGAASGAGGGKRVDLRGDLSDTGRLTELLRELQPDELYHFGAQSDDQGSFELAEYTGNITGLTTVRLVEAIRRVSPATRFIQASTGMLFCGAPPPQHEGSAMMPHSPYSAAKLYAYHLARIYRERYGVFCCSALLFNHESVRRNERYVTRKITRGLARILAGRQETIVLGNLRVRRDWGYAPEFVEAMWRQAQGARPEDLVIGTGEDHAIAEILDVAFGYVGRRPESCVRSDSHLARDIDAWVMRAETAKAARLVGWSPRIGFDTLIKVMVDADMRAMGLEMIGEGMAAVRKAGLGWSLAEWPEPPVAAPARRRDE